MSNVYASTHCAMCNSFLDDNLECPECEVCGTGVGTDMVNHPPHYNARGRECLDAIRAATSDGYQYYLQGNIVKYLWRYRYKNGMEDLKKAEFYLKRLMDEYDEITK